MSVVRRFCLYIAVFFVPAVLAQNTARFAFDISSQPVNTAIVEFALQQDLNIVHLSELTKNLNANRLEGNYSLTEALDILLKGTGLKARITNNRMIKIERVLVIKRLTKEQYSAKEQPAVPSIAEQPVTAEKPLPIEKVQVVAQLLSPYNLGATVSSTKTQREFLQTPQIVNGISAQLAEDIAGRDYTDAILLASSASYLERSTGVADELRLRGFAYPALKINGIGAHAYIAPVDMTFIDHIEVAKGPNSVLFGRMEPGGIINMMLKSAKNAPNSLALKYGTDDFNRAELDLSTSFTDNTDVRALGFIQKQGTEQELNLNDSEGLMLALSHTLESDAVLNIHYRFESQNVLQQFGSPLNGYSSRVEFFRNEEGGIDIVVPREDDVRSGLDVDRNSFYLGLNDVLFGDWLADFHFQYDQYKANSFVRYPIIEDFVIDIDGDTVSSDELREALQQDDELLQLLIDGRETISINFDDVEFEHNPFSYNTRFFSGEFTVYNSRELGGFEVEQLYGLNLSYSKPETLVWQTHDIRSSFVPTEQTEGLFNAEVANRNIRDINAAGFAQWVLNKGAWTGFLGGRLDHLKFSAQNIVGQTSHNYLETSYRFGLVYEISDSSSLFTNYSESFTPQFRISESEQILEAGEDAETLYSVIFPDPAKAHQFELGVKKSWLNDRLQTSCALFDIEKSAIAASVTQQRNKGIECDMAGSLGRNWHINLGASLLDAVITQANNEEILNNRPRMTPQKTLNIWLSRKLPSWSGWQSNLGLGFSYVDSQFVDADNEIKLDAYQLANLSLNAEFKRFNISLFVRNVFDEDYIQGVFNAVPIWANPGAGRSFETRLSYQF